MHERLITHTDVTAFIPGEVEEATLCLPSSEYHESLENDRMLEIHADQLSQRYYWYERTAKSLHDVRQFGETRDINEAMKHYRLARLVLRNTFGRDIIAIRADFDDLVRNDPELSTLQND